MNHCPQTLVHKTKDCLNHKNRESEQECLRDKFRVWFQKPKTYPVFHIIMIDKDPYLFFPKVILSRSQSYKILMHSLTSEVESKKWEKLRETSLFLKLSWISGFLCIFPSPLLHYYILYHIVVSSYFHLCLCCYGVDLSRNLKMFYSP